MNELKEVLLAYVARLEENATSLALFAAAGALAGALLFRFWPRVERRLAPWARRAVPVALLLVALGSGLPLVFEEASCFDDAFIFLRYSWNFAEGHGLVFNVGEHVEGYTNFLWTVLMGAVMWATEWDGPYVAMGACAIAYVANVCVIARLGAALRPDPSTVYLPLAAIAFALQPLSIAYGTSGLETQCASLFVNLGVLFLVTEKGRKRLLGAGAWFIAATLTRPDHGLYFAIAGLVLTLEAGKRVLGAAAPERRQLIRKELLDLASYSAPFAVYLAYLGWKYAYYGSIVPNTYYAKSANLTYFSQGAIYVTEFYLSHHVWPGILALGFLIATPFREKTKRFVSFSILSLVIYTYYVAKVGGDFMEGRFLFPLLPLTLLALERVFYGAAAEESGRGPWRRILVASLSMAALVSCTQSLDLIGGRQIKWGIAHESKHYRITSFSPLRVEHPNFDVGQVLLKLREAGHSPRLATKTVGMPAYYGRGYVLDRRGLTDAHVAHIPLAKRSRPGHEKLADMPYVLSRKVHFIDSSEGPAWFSGQAELQFPGVPRRFSIVNYDRDLMNDLKRLLPGVRFVPAERAIDQYIRELRIRTPKTVSKHLAWLRRYYFDHNDDPERLRKLEAYASGRRELAPQPSLPEPSGAEAPATIAFAGDAILARTVNTLVSKNGDKWPLKKVRHLIFPADLALVNLECVLASTGRQSHLDRFSKAYLRGRPDLVQVLSQAGFDVASLANNHGGDYGPEALTESMEVLRAAGLEPTGAGKNSKDAASPALWRVGSLVVGVIGMQTLVNDFAAGERRAGTNYLSLSNLDQAIEALAEQVTEARRQADVVLVMIHWGPNNRERPNEVHREFAHRAVREAGVDALLGTSAHMLQGIEIVDGRPIIYDAGNLILDWSATRTWTHRSAIFHLEVDHHGVRRILINPILLGYGNAEPAPVNIAKVTLERLKSLSAEMGTAVEISDGKGTISLRRADRTPPPLARWNDPRRGSKKTTPIRRLRANAKKSARKQHVVKSMPKRAKKLDVTFQDGPTLRGFELPHRTTMDLGINPVTYWSTEEPLRKIHEIYFEVVPREGDKSEPAWTGEEHEPADWMLPTAWWSPGDIVRDLYHIKSRAKLDKPKAHDVYVGIKEDKKKLTPMNSSHKTRGNAVYLGTVQLR